MIIKRGLNVALENPILQIVMLLPSMFVVGILADIYVTVYFISLFGKGLLIRGDRYDK